mmetsp:Transcript_66682/g.171704  ORF Transcript_66682/g.171704 Transcript_66682/m.171704 type:complete len:1489 (-) Transcript_66682:73-4539(-)
MLALNEKVRTVALLHPELLLTGKSVSIIATFEEKYLEVKARKQVYLTKADAESFCHYIKVPEERAAMIESLARGLSEVVVLEHLDGEVIERTKALVAELGESIYCSRGKWESMRDLEFFFPHLDSMQVERTLALVKADGLVKGKIDGKYLTEVLEEEAAAAGLFIVGERNLTPSKEEAELVCAEYAGTEDFTGAVGMLTQEPGVVAFCLEGPGAIGKWLLRCGPTNSGIAKDWAPTSIRARWGTDSTSNAVHGSLTFEAAEKELKTFFPEGTLQLQRTLCIVKPHAMKDLLPIRAEIEAAGFMVLNEKQTTITEERAKEFYRDYKERPSFVGTVKEAIAGSCCVMVLCRLEAVSVWQQLMGPASVKDAKLHRPTSIRAKFGGDGQRNAVHGSETAKSAAREVRFFFPQMGADPIPDDNEVRDFLFRKSAGASMDLRSLSANTASDYSVDPTLQQLLSQGLMALCQVQPKGLEAVKWLSRWLSENDPNKLNAIVGGKKFSPPDRTKRVVEYGVNTDGMPFAVEAPVLPKQKRVIEVDVSGEKEENNRMAANGMTSPPYVVFVVGGPESGTVEYCTKLAEEFNFVRLSMPDLMKTEMAAETYLGTEIEKHITTGKPVPDTVLIPLLKVNMQKHTDTNRFLIDSFPVNVEQAKRFEQEVATVSFVLHFSMCQATMLERGASQESVSAFEEQTLQVVGYYGPIGKVRGADAEQPAEAVYAECRKFFCCRFLYLCGPPGAPIAKVAARLTEKYGYSSIDLTALLQTFAASAEMDADKVKQALAKGKPVDASIACPLVLSEIYRDMALGVQNFVICDFPQSLKQAQFIELRVPSVSKPLLLDFTRADAADLAALVPSSMDATEVELRTAAFFGLEMQDMLKRLPNLTRIPCSLAEVDSAQTGEVTNTAEGLENQLVENTWSKVCEKVMPSLTLVLGLPCSGTENLVPLLAKMAPNCQAVDCNQLMDKEMERRTEIGIAMHNMLARGQVVPLSMTLELLKDVANLTCSDSLVIENCPMYADQIEYLTKEFKIDKAYYIAGSGKAVNVWRDAYLGQSQDPTRDAKAFDERVEGLRPVVTHFANLGKLERLDVDAAPTTEQLGTMLEQATMPSFAIVTGLSAGLTPKLAEHIAKSYNLPSALTMEQLMAWAKDTLGKALDQDSPAMDVFTAMKQYADSGRLPLLVLDRFPGKAEDAAAFVSFFGVPKVIVNVTSEDEAIEEEYRAANEEMDDDTVAANLTAMRESYAATIKAFEEACPSALMTLARADFKAEEVSVVVTEMCELVRKKLLPRVYVVVAPQGTGNFSGAIADSICTSLTLGGRQQKCTLIDCSQLFQPGGHSAALEDALYKASFTAEAPDCLPTKLYVELLQEAFTTSANPMGTFLVTNFPTPSAMVATPPTVRDQFCILESLASVEGMLHVALTESAFQLLCSASPEETAAYFTCENLVHEQMLVQLDGAKVCECAVDGDRGVAEQESKKAAAKVCSEFQAFLEKKG